MSAAPYLPSLTDEELVRHAQQRPTFTMLEHELARRLEARLNNDNDNGEQELRTKLEDAEAVLDVLRKELKTAQPFLVALRAADITDTVTLTKRLRIASAAINLFHTINH